MKLYEFEIMFNDTGNGVGGLSDVLMYPAIISVVTGTDQWLVYAILNQNGTDSGTVTSPLARF